MTTLANMIPGTAYRSFLADPEFWPQEDQAEVYAEGVVLDIDGQRYDESSIKPGSITADSIVTIIAGDVFQFFDHLHTLRDHFDGWAAKNHEPGIIEQIIDLRAYIAKLECYCGQPDPHCVRCHARSRYRTELRALLRHPEGWALLVRENAAREAEAAFWIAQHLTLA